MNLNEEFKEIILKDLNSLKQTIVDYIMKEISELMSILEPKCSKNVFFNYIYFDSILIAIYDIGIKECEEEYNRYTSLQQFKQDFEINFKLLKQIQNNFINIFCILEYVTVLDKEFYIKKYKYYNSFKIMLS